MQIYEFILIISDVDEETAEAIYGQCQDSSVGKSHETTYVAFDREAESLESAISSAVDDLKKIGVQPMKVEIEVPATTT